MGDHEDQSGRALYVFIDANILLGLYERKDEDLKELDKLAGLVEVGRIRLLVTDYLVEEYSRNREAKLKNVVERIRNSTYRPDLPALADGYPAAARLAELKSEVKDNVRSIVAAVEKDIKIGTKADEIIGRLLAGGHNDVLSDEVYIAALRRTQLGHPPGKVGESGDRVHWEYLLNHAPMSGRDLHVITNDSDWKSLLDDTQLNGHLQLQWKTRHPSTSCHVYDSITEFAKRNKLDFALQAELDRAQAVLAFVWSKGIPDQAIINRLEGIRDFSDHELAKLLDNINYRCGYWEYKEQAQLWGLALVLIEMARERGLEVPSILLMKANDFVSRLFSQGSLEYGSGYPPTTGT